MELMIPLRTARAASRCIEQIYQLYQRRDPLRAASPAAARLPSTRTLAEHLKVSRSTTQMAYDQLMSEGYIEAAPCKGYYVLSIEELVNVTEEPLPAPAGEAGRRGCPVCGWIFPRGASIWAAFPLPCGES